MLCINYSERDFPKKSIKFFLSKTDETKTLHVQIPETSIFAPNQLLFSAQDECLKLRKIHQLELKSPHRNKMNDDDSTVR